MKAKFWKIENVITTFKCIATSLITGVVLAIPFFIGMWFVQNGNLFLGRGFQLLTGLSYFLVWGFFASKFWGWK